MIKCPSFLKLTKKFQLKQAEVAKVLGVRPQSYQLYEYGKVIPSTKVILKLADTYDVPTDYLLGRSDNLRALPVDSELIEAIQACQRAISPVREKLYTLKNLRPSQKRKD